MIEKNKKPSIRFKGFIGNWDQHELDEIVDVLDGDRGKNYPNDNDLQEEGHTLFLSATNVTRNGFSFKNNQYIKEEKSNSMGNGKLELNDIILTSRGSLGHIAWYDEISQQQVPFARINSGMLILRPKVDIMPGYITQYLKSPLGKKQIDLISFGSAQPQLTKKDVSNYKIFIPSNIVEQKKIGEFFHSLDNIITLKQRKYDKLINIKKAMLEKMIPKNGSNRPEIRFKGFTDDWKLYNVKEICSISTGKSNTQDKIDDGKYPFYVRSPIVEHSDKYLYEEEAVLTVGDGVGTGKVFHYVNGKYDLHQRVYRMFDFNGVHGKYFYYYFSNHFYNRVMSMTAKTSVDSVRLEMIADMEIKCPSMEEQNEVAKFFTEIDNLITLHQQELEKLKNMKKACLQRMFL